MGTAKGKDGKNSVDCGKYARYTPEQVEILERVYNDCPKPSSTRRQQLIKECPILANIGQRQLKVWFQNRRCREKQRKETSRLQNWNSKLNAMNQILLEENERLQKQAAQLSSENQYLRQQLQIQQPNSDLNQRVSQPVIMATTDTSSESVVTSGQQHQHSPQHPSQEWSLSQLSIFAEKTLTEFLAKATGSVVDGIPLPGMKPGPGSIGALALSRSCGGVAAQACGLIELEPIKVAEIVKNRPSWLPDCRRLDILATFTADRGGLVELVHTQMYAPTTVAAPRDFWTLRYTCCLEEGSLVICERSLAAGQGIQAIPTIPGFVRAEMLPSGFLIRPCEQGGSMVMVVDDFNFNFGSIPEGLRPLYETSTVLARRMTQKVLCHLHSIAREKSEVDLVNNPTSSLRGFSHRLIRGFNDAVNCFPDEGWVSIIDDGPSSVSVHINPPPTGTTMGGGIICAKASLLLQSVPPPLLVRFLRERWTSWAEFDSDTSQGDTSRPSFRDNLPKKKFSSVRVFQPIVGQDEVLEVVRLQRTGLPRGDDISQLDNFLLQLCSGIEDTAVSAHAQLIFAPIDASIPDDAPLLPSGFRVVHLDSCSEGSTLSPTLDLASTLEAGSESNSIPSCITRTTHELKSVLTIAFQYMYDVESREIVALKAQRHMQALVDFVQHAAISLCLPRLSSIMDPLRGVEALVLVQQIADSYRFHLGQELLLANDGSAEVIFKSFWTLRHAIVCCAWKPLPEFIFANHSALEMLETNLSALREMSLERMFNDGCKKTDYSKPPPFIQKEGYARLPAGLCITSMGRPVSFEHAIGWKAITGDHSLQVAAFMFCNWSFVPANL